MLDSFCGTGMSTAILAAQSGMAVAMCGCAGGPITQADLRELRGHALAAVKKVPSRRQKDLAFSLFLPVRLDPIWMYFAKSWEYIWGATERFGTIMTKTPLGGFVDKAGRRRRPSTP